MNGRGETRRFFGDAARLDNTATKPLLLLPGSSKSGLVAALSKYCLSVKACPLGAPGRRQLPPRTRKQA